MRAILLAGLALLLAATAATAQQRVPSRKTAIRPSSGAREDITVPFLSNGFSTLGVANGVSPIIIKEKALELEDDAQARPVINLQFYGSKQSFDSKGFGATQRPPNSLRPRR
jgi:hypothetical protein